MLFARLDGRPASIRREAAPLPLPFLDADLWIFRIPADALPSSGDELTREAIEHYFENEWIHRERKGLGEPVAAGCFNRRRARRCGRAGQAHGGRETARTARRPREHQGPLQGISVRPLAKAARPGMRRLPPRSIRSTWAVQRPMSSTCWILAALDDARLIDAASSAAGLGDDARTARFAAELVRRGAATLGPSIGAAGLRPRAGVRSAGVIKTLH